MSLNLLEEVSLSCPYCGEYFTTVVDTSVESQSYIEDCQVCCSPIIIDVQIEDDSELIINTRQENE